ncbi:MAG: hypothetical protein E7309_06440 [Butyrivibrio sp.]|nr:hypothetical protein [Butyrivibrio sp.]
MKVAIISDIHIDINEKSKVDQYIKDWYKELVAAKEAEALIIAGDISEDVQKTIAYVKELEEAANAPVYYVPGNHDMWNRDKKYESNDAIYDLFLQDPHCLSGKKVELGDHVVIGDIGWYDYSYANTEKFTKEEFDSMTTLGRTWQDKYFNTWTDDNQAKSDQFNAAFKKALDETAALGKNICFVTHMINHDAFSVPDGTNKFCFFNAYLGNRTLQQILTDNAYVDYSISGHIHFRKDAVDAGKKWLCRCLGYDSEWPLFHPEEEFRDKDNDVLWHIKDAAEIIEL